MDRIRRKEFPAWWGVALGGVLFLAALPLTLPVVLGVLVAAALETPVRRLQEKTGMGRRAASALCVTWTLFALGISVWWLGKIALQGLLGLSGRLPALLSAGAAYLERFVDLMETLGTRLPEGAGDALTAWARGIISGSGSMAQELYGRVFSLVSRLLSALPRSLMFLLTMVLSCYFAAGDLPRLWELANMHLPGAWFRRLHRLLRGMREALGGWARAQLRLMGVTFLLLLGGFLVLRVRSAIPLALGIAVLDALPLLGTGTILIPWALGALLGDNLGLALGLLALYGITALLRNILEPRFLGAQFGVSPLLTLGAIYGGWRIGGVWGMLLLPVGLLVGVRLFAALRTPVPEQSIPVKYPEK